VQVAGCEFCRWVGPERRPDGRLGERAGSCPHCGKSMLWMTDWDARVLGAQSATRGRLAVERVQSAIHNLEAPSRSTRVSRLFGQVRRVGR